MSFKEIWQRLRGIIIFGIFYMTAFFFMEMRIVPVHIIHTRFDDMIPFCEYFIIPYTIWYAYVVFTVLYLGLSKRKLKEYNSFIYNMILGMIVFVLTSLIYPNGQNMRPVIYADNIFLKMVALLYTIDTPTNILPSLHVFASVACAMALLRDERFRKRTWARISVYVLTVSICLSTMFLKQHSIVDVIAAFVCNALAYPLVYRSEALPQHQTARKKALVKQE